MEPSFEEDPEGKLLVATAKFFRARGNHIKALEMYEDMIFNHGEDKNASFFHHQQGQTFWELAERTENPFVEFAYVLGSVECFSEDGGLAPLCANSLYMLANLIRSSMFFKMSVKKAKKGLAVIDPDNLDKKEALWTLIEDAEFKINFPGTSVSCTIKESQPKVWDSKKSQDLTEDAVKRLRSYWMGLDVKIKKNFMKVSIAELVSFVNGVHKREGRDALEEVLTFARENKKWTFWICRTSCLNKFSSAEECKIHFEQEHAADFKPPSKEVSVLRIGKDWARKILVGGWEPVDTVAAVEMIKNQLPEVKAFASKSKKNGWSKEWPLAEDEERNKLLKDIKLLLVSLCDLKILSCSIRDWVMRFPVKYLGKLEVSEQSLIDSHLVETPQSICFLDCHELNQILDFLKSIKRERCDGTYLVCRAVDSVLDRTRVKEKIDFDPHFSFVLLDKRLLKSNEAPFDDEGTINVFDPIVHYAKAHAQGDDIISWLVDYSSVDKSFPRPIREHNLDIWLAVLRAVQFTCRNLRTKYAKKVQVLIYDAALTIVKNVCVNEDKRRRNLQQDQWNRYASILCDRCEETYSENSFTAKLFLCAVRDVLEGTRCITLDLPDLEDCQNFIRKSKSLSDDIVLMSIDLLESVVTQKVLLIDSKILLIDNSRIRLLNNLTRLSVFDNRTYMLQLLKPFLLNKIVNMESKATSDAAEADLLLAEEKKSRPKNKKANKNNKRISTSMSSSLEKTVEHEPSVSLEPEDASPSLKTVEEDSMEPEDTLASQKGRIEISSDNQGEAAKDVQNMPGEDSLSEHLESALGGAAARYNSALCMTLKGISNIKVLKEYLVYNRHQFPDNLEEQVSCALRNFFTAFISKQIKEEGLHSYLLDNLLTSLEEARSMSNDAAELLVAILEFWPCWKSRRIESLVTRIFALEEYESMSCSKCRKTSNYPEQSFYGVVIAADSIRELRCAFGNIKFENILKLIRMGDKMLCDIKTGGCGKANFVHHIISRCSLVFTIVLKWEKDETEKEISETTKALAWEIDISMLCRDLEPNTKYRLVSMVGYGEEDEEYICLAYKKNRWVSFRHEALVKKVIGNWKSVVKFCGERKIRPQILFYEAARSMS